MFCSRGDGMPCFWESSGRGRCARRALVAGCISGACGAGLIALINTSLSVGSSAEPALIGAFVGIAMLMFGTNMLSQVLFIRLAQGSIFTLRMQLSRRILGVPLRQLELIGTHRLLTALTDDILEITNALPNLPLLCIFITSVSACLIYLAWLSWSVFLVGVTLALLGIFGFQLLAGRALSSLALARESQEHLFHHLLGLISGNKELKLHRQRREAFFSQQLCSSASSYKQHNVVGMTAYASARGAGDCLFFIFLGLVLFALPRVQTAESQALTGAALIVLYMMTPLTFILNTLPVFGRAIW